MYLSFDAKKPLSSGKFKTKSSAWKGKTSPKKKRERERSFVEKIFQETLKPVNVNQSSFFKDITVKVFFF